MNLLIAIPARFGSKRFPGKPLAKIHGKTMLQRVYDIALKASRQYPGAACVVATEEAKIVDFCREHDITCCLTSNTCKTGTDRIQEIIDQMKSKPDFVVNLQGDNPLCPPWIVEAVIDAYKADQTAEVITPCVQLTWGELEQLRINKKATPFTGTTAVVDKNLNAVWFSKQILPAIRNEEKIRAESPVLSPVLRHIGLYGYRTDILQRIASLEEGYYEKFEGLEQLRFLENGIKIKVVLVDYRGRESMSGVDSPEDIQKAEALLTKYGEF